MASGRNKAPRKRTDNNLAQFGLFGMPMENDDNDSDLEAELRALAGDARPERPQRSKKPAVPAHQLDAMIADSLRDIPDDEELSGDDDDPELLSELQEITGSEESSVLRSAPSPPQVETSAEVSVLEVLESRLKMYETAETHAKSIGETSRARRYNRAIKTLKDLIKQARAGKPIPPDEIPPEVSTNIKKPAEVPPPTVEDQAPPLEPDKVSPTLPQEPEPASPASTQDNTELLQMLQARKDQYKAVALKAKKMGDKATAINYVKIAKQFEAVISAVESGQPVDLSQMPGPPQEPVPQMEHSEVQKGPDSPQPSQPQPQPEDPPSESGLITASTVEEALLQRLEVYKKQADAAKAEGNSSKARRMGRVVKQFEDALKLHKAGKPIPVDELPTPPGYGPIPVPGSATPKPPPAAPQPKPAVPQRPSPPAPRPQASGSGGGSVRISGNHTPTARLEQQVAMLLAKQKEFKRAALNAKQKGEINQAKEYLKTAKGFDPLIEAARGGLPVDLATLPLSPIAKSQLDEDYDLVMADECDEEKNEDFNLISRLEAQLTKQLKMCLSTRDHHKALGDVAGTNRFEQLALSVTRDLDVVRLAQKTPGCRIPKFHYENKDFSIVKSFVELGENDLELTIVRGISYTCDNPKEIDTYVKFEFPYPQDEGYRDKTSVVKDTNSPEYNATFTIPIQRTARNCLRVFKRHGIKFEVYSKGWCASNLDCCFSGFFRGDTLLGTVNVKLQQLETQCEMHDSFDLMDGRKKVGGKLEIRLRVRHPLLTKQIEQIHEKWLVLDH